MVTIAECNNADSGTWKAEIGNDCAIHRGWLTEGEHSSRPTTGPMRPGGDPTTGRSLEAWIELGNQLGVQAKIAAARALLGPRKVDRPDG